MAPVDIADKVLEHIRLRGASRAKQIAEALGVERSVVNGALYGPLRGRVQQAKDYTWSVANAAPDYGRTFPTSKNSRDRLFAYYLDCLSHDDDSGVEAFADSKYGLDYVELGEWPFEAAEPNFSSEPLQRLMSRQRREPRKKVLWLGYPVLIHRVRSEKWEGAFMEPLLIWPQDPDAKELGFLPEPQVNTRALQSLAPSEGVLEEAAQLADELGLEASESPPLDELAARLRALRPEWEWKEPLAPTGLRGFGEVRRIKDGGIYNAAVVVIADRSPFTVGLERELSDLRTVSDGAIAGSSLGTLLGAAGAQASIDGPLLEATPLNSEQRAAVTRALADPLTVITGPPGTGKSQVVTAILVNAAWRGLRVLFASKNNKAVDVVMERMNALSQQPVVLRLGTRAVQQELAEHIGAILSARPTEHDRRSYESRLARLRSEGEALERLVAQTNRLIELRNTVDALERAAEPAREILPPALFANADKLRVGGAEARLAELEAALQRFNRKVAPLLQKVFWKFLRQARHRDVVAAAERLADVLSPLGFQRSDALSPYRTSVLASEYLKALKTAFSYQAALAKLSAAPDTGALAARVARQSQALASVSGDVWSIWATLLPDRLNDQDRRALGDYAAILRTISGSDGGAISRQVWRQYYQLAARTAAALPCWAVTSLSARGRVPFTAGEFDLLVIDEASQCDIASALPLLFRAKRTVVIGDPQQLRHISRLPKPRDEALMVKYNILDDPGPNWGYRANSLYDLSAARARSTSVVALRDHHRSHADIINFSNQFFYKGNLRVATDYRRLKRPDGPALRWVNATGETFRPPTGGAVNQPEAVAVVEELRRIAITQRFSGEMGVVTPFRAQANLIEELVARDDVLAAVLASRNFICETAHKFQGDERDLIIFSPVLSRSAPPSAVRFLQGQGNIFNVGITRARGGLLVVGDAAACTSSGVTYLSAFARYVKDRSGAKQRAATAIPLQGEAGGAYPAVARPELVSDWEKVFYGALVDTGLRPIPQYPVDQYVLDLALIRHNGRRLDIEIDGERYHRDWDGELVRRDQLRNLRLVEMGWDVLRLWVYQVRDSLPTCVTRVKHWAEAADTLPPLHGEDGSGQASG